MPWLETCVMEERIKFIMIILENSYSMTELCSYYNISRKTGYKWLNRYMQGGIEALKNRSRAPINHPYEISSQVRDAILEIKKRFPKWGARKIRDRLERVHPGWQHYPAVSTIGLFLKKQGLTSPVKRRNKCTPTESPLTTGQYSNHVWCADFKGHFKTGNGRRCNPLTISDHFSRYLLCCRHLDTNTYELTKRQFERIFRQYGLPEVIRTDNGSPFACTALGGLSRLSYWWIRLGIYPERIEPGHPEQNGRHERMHKTLKNSTACPPANNLAQQQKRFDSFVQEYNEYRAHEALQMRTPSECYSNSPRAYPSRLSRIDYPDHMYVRRVQMHGDIILKDRRIFLTQSLQYEYVGIEQIDEDTSLIWYCNYLLGRLDHKNWKITAAESRPFISAASCGYKPIKS
jgi:transposase InsO family protein